MKKKSSRTRRLTGGMTFDRNKSLKRDRKSYKKTFKKEMMLLRTLAITVLVFIISWGPYAFCIIIDSRDVGHNAKKVS